MSWHIGGREGPAKAPLGHMTQGIGFPLRAVDPSSVITYGVAPTEDAGDGTVEGDMNATNWTGNPFANGACLGIEVSHVVTVIHKGVSYLYQGPRGVCIGIGGDYSSVAADYSVVGTADHDLLQKRDLANAHPIAAITGLEAEQAAQDQALIDHQNAPDPHPQYTFEGHGGIIKATDTAYGTIGSGAWTTIDNWDDVMVFSPVGVIQDVANSGLRVVAQGAYKITGTIAISFTDTNQGRVFSVRLWNDTKGVAGREVDYFVGRNQAGINVSQGALLLEIGAEEVNDLLQLQIAGAGNSFSNVSVVDAMFSLTRHA